MSRNRVAKFLDDEREFTPEECERICTEAMDAAIQSLMQARVPEPMRTTVVAAFTKMTADMMLALKFVSKVKGVKLREEIESGVAIADAMSAFWKKYQEGVHTCQAKGGSPACK